MKALTSSQIKYVLYHLNHHVQLANLESRFQFSRNWDLKDELSNQVVFLLSDKDLNLSAVFSIDGLPILFPCLEQRDFYFFDRNGNLVFCHDILKAIFYLLSGYQEFANPNSRDSLNRFSYHDSIQCKLGIIDRPIVNYYVQVLVNGLQAFCLKNNFPFNNRKLFQTFGFLLTHDIDVVDYYTYNYLGYKFKEILGIKKSKVSVGTNIKLFVYGLLKYLRVAKKNNPYWNFDRLRQLEKHHHLRSVFFFLDKGVKNHDAHYAFEEKRVADLFNFLQKENCEIGMHGTVRSVRSAEVMNANKQKLERVSKAHVIGNRQHRLLWEHSQTAEIEEQIGLKYDSTLGFAAHEGFRNSYAWPYRLYSFEQDRMLNIWEYPLNVMDVTLFAYQGYSPEIALEKCRKIIDEVQRVGGLFTILWHNSFFDEDLYPGVTNFYSILLQDIVSRSPQNMLGSELTKLMESHSQ